MSEKHRRKVAAELTYVLMEVSPTCVPLQDSPESRKLQVVNTNRSTTVPQLKMESAEAAPVCGSEKGQTGCVTS